MVVDAKKVKAPREASDGEGRGEGTGVALAHVDRTTADLAAAALSGYGIDAEVVVDPTAGNAKAPVARTAPAFGVVVRPDELALACDVLRRSTQDLPPEFRDDEMEAWSAQRAVTRRRGAEPMVRAGAIAVAALVLAVLTIVAVVAVLS